MSSSDFVATQLRTLAGWVTEHACVNYLHVASHDYQEVIQYTH